MKKLLLPLFLSLIFFSSKAVEKDTSSNPEMEALVKKFEKLAEIEKAFQKGEIDLKNDLATLKVPEGYKFLNAELSQYVLTELWGNPPDYTTLGLLFPDSSGPMNFTSYVVEISYSEEGYIEDDDAKDINYDDLLADMKKEAADANPDRIRQGYPSVEIIGWASSPFYDEQTKKLHWAKELKFGEDSLNTLNYSVRILGRKGYINMNVIGQMDILPEVKKDIDVILASAEFKEGNKYSDFNPDIDKVAAYGIGGLIAGKVLAKAGFFAGLMKFGKFIIFGIVALGGAAWRFLTGRGGDDEQRA